jgi:hypothetical protein
MARKTQARAMGHRSGYTKLMPEPRATLGHVTGSSPAHLLMASLHWPLAYGPGPQITSGGS